jgi:hypothetical protein
MIKQRINQLKFIFMENLTSFSNLLDEIFKDFESERPLVVLYHVGTSESDKRQKPRYRVESVNGYLTMRAFTHRMVLLQLNLMTGVLEALRNLPPQERLIFLQQVLVRGQKLYGAVTRVRVDGSTGTTARDPGETMWVFRSPCGINLSGDAEPEDAEQIISRITSGYAELWYHIVRQFMKELRFFRYLIREFTEVVINK